MYNEGIVKEFRDLRKKQRELGKELSAAQRAYDEVADEYRYLKTGKPMIYKLFVEGLFGKRDYPD